MMRPRTPLRQNKTSYGNRPKSITLGIQNEYPKNTFKISFPAKRLSDHCKSTCRRPISGNKKVIKTQNNRQNTQISIEPDRLRQIFNEKLNRVYKKSQEIKQGNSKVLFKPKIKYKTNKTVNSQRNYTVNYDTKGQQEDYPSKKASCFIFGLSHLIESINEQKKIAQSPNTYFHRSTGKKQRFDSYMYLRKVKANNQKKAVGQICGQSYTNAENNSQRQLYIRKDQNRKKSGMSAYINYTKNKKKIKVKKYEEEKHEYRPWSADNSDRQN